eukprot:7189566-Pyramimonas_sp.AAC.1
MTTTSASRSGCRNAAARARPASQWRLQRPPNPNSPRGWPEHAQPALATSPGHALQTAIDFLPCQGGRGRTAMRRRAPSP